MSATKTNKERQSAYKERMRQAGFVQVTKWVKKGSEDTTAKYIEELVDALKEAKSRLNHFGHPTNEIDLILNKHKEG